MVRLLFILALFYLCPAQGQMIHPVSRHADAKFSVAIVADEKNADLKVFRTDSLNSEVFKNRGVWAISEHLATQTIPVFWTTDSTAADLRIVLVPASGNAGWINKNKRSLFKKN